MSNSSLTNSYTILDSNTLKRAYYLMCVTREMNRLFEENRSVAGRYRYSTSRGHEAIQIAAGMHLGSHDYAALYYRDEAMLLGMGWEPYELMLQLLAKKEDPFSGGRSYYAHPYVKRSKFPTIVHHSSVSATHVIPATGIAQGLVYLSSQNLRSDFERPIVLCSLGDGAITEGEASEAIQMAVLKRLPIVYLVQDNDWSASTRAEEYRAMDAYEYAAGFKGLKRVRVNGADFVQAYENIQNAIEYARIERLPILLHAKCPLIGDHSSDIRREKYRDEENISMHSKDDPIFRLKKYLVIEGETDETMEQIALEAKETVEREFERAFSADDPDPATVLTNTFVPTPVMQEKGSREAANRTIVSLAEAAIHALDEILTNHPEAIYLGQQIGVATGGQTNSSAALVPKFGTTRIFNASIQEAYTIGSTAGMAVVGCKPIVEVPYADYVWSGLNQLVHTLSQTCYLSNGQFPIQALIRIPVGAYSVGGPFQSSSIESVLLQIRGIKVVYPSNAADMKGLMKAAFADPNPVVMLEHRGLRRPSDPFTTDSQSFEPDSDYTIPLGQASVVQQASEERLEEGYSAVVITYGMGVYWAKAASEQFPGAVEILDLRTLYPLDWDAVVEAVKRHNKALVLTEEPLQNSFAEALAGRITQTCFKILDAPVFTCGAANLPAIPLNTDLEKAVLPSTEKVAKIMGELLNY